MFFRQSARKKAIELGLVGWVKNLPDGKVEIMAEGEEKDLKSLVDWCYNGPKGAEVEKVNAEWDAYNGKFNHFEILFH